MINLKRSIRITEPNGGVSDVTSFFPKATVVEEHTGIADLPPKQVIYLHLAMGLKIKLVDEGLLICTNHSGDQESQAIVAGMKKELTQLADEMISSMNAMFDPPQPETEPAQKHGHTQASKKPARNPSSSGVGEKTNSGGGGGSRVKALMLE